MGEQDPGPEIVVGVDGSPAAAGAVAYGLDVAAASGARLRLVHAVPSLGPVPPLGSVVDPDRTYAVGSALLLDLTRQARLAVPSVEVRTTLQQGAVVPVLVEAAQHAALVVLGRRAGRRPLHLLSGGTAAAVTKHILTPVTVVPGGWRPGSANRDVVLGLKGLTTSSGLLIRGLELARRAGGALVVLHAWQVPAGYEDLVPAAQAEAWSTQLRERILGVTADPCSSFPDVPVRVQVVQDSPVNALSQSSGRAGLVLVGRRARTGTWVHLGSVPRALQRVAECPVEVSPVSFVPETEIDLELERDGVLLR